MKKLITLCLIMITAFTVKAQSPTYEETVNYIIQNTKGRVMYPGDLDAYSRTNGYNLKDIKIEKNGKIELITDHKFDYNSFNIIFNIFDLVEKVDYPDGIRAYKFLVHFNGLNVSSGYGITFATDADAQKIARAFRHLKTLCVKPDDLFSKIPDEEKKSKLSMGETINYINNLLYNLPKSQLDTYEYIYYKTSVKDKASYDYYWYPKEALQYNKETNKYTITYRLSYQNWWGLYKESEVELRDEIILEKGSSFSPFSVRDITEFNEDWDGTYVTRDGKTGVTDGSPNFKTERHYKLFQVKLKTGGWIEIKYNSSEPKFAARLKSALLRLKELDKDNVDPFD